MPWSQRWNVFSTPTATPSGTLEIPPMGTRMCKVNVALPSGRSEEFSIPQSSKVRDLRVQAQKSFQLGFLRLVTADHRVVDPTLSLQAAGLEDGDRLTAIAVEAKVSATAFSFALFCCQGDRVVTWGSPHRGGDSSHVQDQLKRVQHAQATEVAFAAILENGSVVTWGNRDCGGDSSEVQDKLRGVQHVQATEFAFAATLADGSVVTWGNPNYGGESSKSKISSEVSSRFKQLRAHLLPSWQMDP